MSDTQMNTIQLDGPCLDVAATVGVAERGGDHDCL